MSTPLSPPWDRPVYRLTAEQALRMAEAGIIPEGGGIELLDGVLHLKDAGEPHNTAVMVVAEAFRPLAALAPARHHVREQKSNTADPYALPEPDVAVVKGGVLDYLPTPPPPSALAIVVEVNATTPDDHTRKLAGYAAAGVPAYWVVDVDYDQVVEYTVPNASGGYDRRVLHRRGESLAVVIAGHPCGEVRVEEILPGVVALRVEGLEPEDHS
jgi:Uma2 family endonuclease